MRRFLMVCAAVLFCATAAGAQTKLTGSYQCTKPDPQHLLPVGDQPDHVLGLSQFKCMFAKPMEMGGDKAKEGVITDTSDVNGDTSGHRGFHVVTTESGDKVFFRHQGTATSKDDEFVEFKGTWEFTGGSGKLKGIKGKGTITCTPLGDGISCNVEGEYQLAK